MVQDTPKRRQLLKSIGAAGSAIALAGCGGNGNGNGGNGNGGNGNGGNGNGGNGNGGGTTESGPAAHVAMVYPVAGLGDQGFSDNAQQGLINAEEQLNIEYQEGEPSSNSEFQDFHNQFASSQDPDYDLIIGLTFDQITPIEQVSANFPDQKWTLIDAAVEGRDNVANIAFKEHEGSYLSGTLAGYIAQNGFDSESASAPGNGVVGFVGGARSPVIERFHAGYRAGVKSVDENIEFRSAYAGAFNAPGQGQSIANSMFENGADIVYHAAGGTGIGMFDAARSAGRPAIGVDTDQSVTASDYAGVIVASMLKRMDSAVMTTIENVVNDEWDGTSTVRLGLPEDAHELVYGQEIGDAVPQEAKDMVSSARQSIIDGEVTPPTSVE